MPIGRSTLSAFTRPKTEIIEIHSMYRKLRIYSRMHSMQSLDTLDQWLFCDAIAVHQDVAVYTYHPVHESVVRRDVFLYASVISKGEASAAKSSVRPRSSLALRSILRSMKMSTLVHVLKTKISRPSPRFRASRAIEEWLLPYDAPRSCFLGSIHPLGRGF